MKIYEKAETVPKKPKKTKVLEVSHGWGARLAVNTLPSSHGAVGFRNTKEVY